MMLYIPIIRNPIIISCVHTYRYRKRLSYHVATTSLCHPGCPTLVHAIAGYHLRPGGEGPHPMNWHWLLQIGSNGVRFIVLSWFVRLSTQFWRKFDFTFRGKRRTGGEKALMAVLWKALKKRIAGIIQYRKEFTSKFQLSSHPQMRFCLEIKFLPICPQRNLTPETHYTWKAWLQGKSHSRNSVRGKRRTPRLNSRFKPFRCWVPLS